MSGTDATLRHAYQAYFPVYAGCTQGHEGGANYRSLWRASYKLPCPRPPRHPQRS